MTLRFGRCGLGGYSLGDAGMVDGCLGAGAGGARLAATRRGVRLADRAGDMAGRG